MTVDKSKMNEIFGNLKKDSNVAILLQMSPDPDCLGAASGMAVLLKEIYNLESKIFHFGEISHPQNKSMKNILHILLNDGHDFHPDDFSATVVLDTDLASTGFQSDNLSKVDLRIDHHKMDRDEEPQLSDVRMVGSTCAIVWDYLKEFNVSLEHEANVATAMILGIKTDTLDFTSDNLSELDIEAFSELLPFVNKISLARVNKFPLPKEVFEKEAEAFKVKKIVETTLVSYIGEVSAHSRDLISTIADRFARMAGVSTVVIMAVIDNHLQASVRSDDSRVDVVDLCTKVFGKEFSGAKEGSGGARVPLGDAFKYIRDKEVRDKVIQEIFLMHRDNIFETLGEETTGEETNSDK